MYYHLVWSTFKRQRLLSPDVNRRLFPYIRGIIQKEGELLFEISGVDDHIHLLVGIRPDKAVSALVRTIKAGSSKWIHLTFEGLPQFAWQEGYGVFSVSKSITPDVIAYIQKQEEHHRVKPFHEEFVELLKKHGLPFDERYIWG
jgi:REP element-mobilizing transposase RayT